MDYQIIRENEVLIAYAQIETEHKHSYEHEKAHELLAQVLKEHYNVDYNQCIIGKEEHGKPYFENVDLQFNISHCRGMVVCALAKGLRLGVDVENVRAVRDAVTRKVLSEAELMEFQSSKEPEKVFFRAWTYKESVVKLSGNGIREDLKKIDSKKAEYSVNRHELECGEEYYIICVASSGC